MTKGHKTKRLLIFAVSLGALYFGITGVAQMTKLYAQYASVQIPSAWYAMGIVPSILAGVITLFLPEKYFREREQPVAGILLALILVAAGTGPILYIVYDYEHVVDDASSQAIGSG